MLSKKKKNIIMAFLLILFLGLSFLVYTISSAITGDNRLRIKNVEMTSIQTGSGSFDSSDGLSYLTSDSQDYSKDTGYTAGNDAKSDNRIVRSFDTIVYNFSYSIIDKQGTQSFENRTVNITVDLTDEEAKYVTFGENDLPGVKTKTFSFENVSTYDIEDAEITLYVLGAPNGTIISPKFTIKESTDNDEGIVLGNSGENVYNYSYSEFNYNHIPTFLNYMPTVVSSKDGIVSLKVLTSNPDSIKNGTYNGQNGRYITYVTGVRLNGDGTKGIKGLTMPTGNISFDVNFTQTGSNTPAFEEKWARLYGLTSIDDIDPITVNIPYSTKEANASNKEIVSPGNLNVTSKGNNSYTITISNYNPTYYYPSLGADAKSIGKDAYFSSVALTTFSPRTIADGKNDINVTLGTSNGSVSLTSGTNSSIENTSTTNVNKYYEISDYSLKGEFYDFADNKLAKETNVNGTVVKNGTGSVSKGTTVYFKTQFDYKKTLSNQGLKEVVKIDSNAFRFVPISDGIDYEINLNCGGSKCSGITEKDFEVKFVTGSFDANNYSSRNLDELILGEEDIDRSSISSQCSAVSNNLSSYNINQIQNLYGGPCIVANDGVENEYEKISSAKITNEEDAVATEDTITKAIIQTKEGVKLPENISITMKFALRVRNVSDITQTYQATVLASTSDYDDYTYYYTPTVSDTFDSVCNPDNYIKTVYQGTTPLTADDSMFGDTLRIVNFTAREDITVTNQNSDGSLKTNYDVKNNETITYNVKTVIEDNNEAVGADDTWYINNLVVTVNIPSELEYIPDKSLMTPVSVDTSQGITKLYYKLPYTKPNMKIEDIQFRTRIKPTLPGTASAYPITVTSSVYAENINGEVDNSIIGSLSSSFTIYATGIKDVIIQQEVGKSGTIVEKNTEINYILKGYNNTGAEVKDYTILDILPYTGDDNKSSITGKYSVKITLPDSLSEATILCSKQSSSTIKKEPLNNSNNFEECDISNTFVDKVTAIKIENITIPKNSYMGDVIVTLKPEGNNYSNTYNNNFYGENRELSKNISNTIKVKVVSRKISGKVFMDISGDGVQDGNERAISGIPVTLYSIGDDNSIKKVKQAETDKDGNYEFNDLDKGRYKVGFLYDKDTYDLTLRYATEDTTKDSDAYKVSDDGEAEITNKKVPDDPNGIRLSKDITSVTHMDMGLISRQSFGFSMRKYITRIELNYNGSITNTNYNNQSMVSISVRNSKNASAKVYYGIEITNNSTKSGYINEIDDYIPEGMIFDNSYIENQGWFEMENGRIMTTALSDTLIKPGESKYLQIALYLPQREESGLFLNTAMVVDSTIYDPDALTEDNEYVNNNTYSVGDEITYGGVDWHVISVDSENVTLLANSGTIRSEMSHTSSSADTYKWSSSQINSYINGDWENYNTLNLSSLIDQVICDDASGLQEGSYGGTLSGTCMSGIYTTSKVRLLTLDEYTTLTTSGLSDISWLYGSKSFWLQNSDYISPEYLEKYINAYNETTTTDVNYGIQQNSVYNKSMYINVNSRINLSDLANKAKEVRPVIKVPINNIIVE